MAQQKSFTWLLILLLIVVILFIGLTIFEKIGTSSQAGFGEFNVTQVDGFYIQPPHPADEVILKKVNNQWFVKIDGKQYLAEQQIANQVIVDFSEIKSEKIVETGVKFFDYYQLDNEHALHLIARSGDKILRHLLLGKYEPIEPESPTMVSYVRFEGKPEIYAVNEFLHISFQTDPAYYRNKRLTNISYQKMQKIEFQYPADSSFTLTQPQKGLWLVDGKPGDSDAIEKFTGTLGFLMSGDFVDQNLIQLPEEPTMSVTISGNGETFVVSAFWINDTWYVTSSHDKSSLWNASINNLFQRVFSSKKDFLAKK